MEGRSEGKKRVIPLEEKRDCGCGCGGALCGTGHRPEAGREEPPACSCGDECCY